MRRVKARITGIIIALVVVFVIIPLLGWVSSIMERTPTWIYYSCLGLGGVVVFIFVLTQVRSAKDAATQYKEQEDALQEFKAKLHQSPEETKKQFLELQALIIKKQPTAY